jgi:D-hydroxyproline dehydrogenase subunit beta
VTVLEASFPAAGATGAAMGHVVVMEDSEAQLALTALSRRLWTERAGELPARRGGRPVRDALGRGGRGGDGARARQGGPPPGPGGGRRGARRPGAAGTEPQLRDGLAGGLLVPGDRVIYPPAAARALLEGARRRGAEVWPGVRVEAAEPGRVVCCGGRRLEADVVVNAAGPWAPHLTPGLPVLPRKGHLVVTDRCPGFLRHQVIELGYLKSAGAIATESVAMNVQPRKTGQLLVGSSRELVGFDASINRPLCASMLRRASSYLPGLPLLPALRTWTGFRPATPDKLPLVGEWEPGLWVAAGHEGLGIATAPGSARLLADLLLGRTPPIDPAPFARAGGCPPMPERVRFTVDGQPVEAEAGESLLAALWNAGRLAVRRSVSGEPRGPLCGMGTCHECRVTSTARRTAAPASRRCARAWRSAGRLPPRPRPRIGRIVPDPTRADGRTSARAGPLAAMRPTS